MIYYTSLTVFHVDKFTAFLIVKIGLVRFQSNKMSKLTYNGATIMSLHNPDDTILMYTHYTCVNAMHTKLR